MGNVVDILAGPELAPLWGHQLSVAGHTFRVGPEGEPTSVPHTVATRLLAQGGWRAAEMPTQAPRAARKRGDER